MKKIFILLAFALTSCEIADYRSNKFVLNSVRRYDGPVCKYVVEFPNSDKFTFLDSCGKFNAGDTLSFK